MSNFGNPIVFALMSDGQIIINVRAIDLREEHRAYLIIKVDQFGNLYVSKDRCGVTRFPVTQNLTPAQAQKAIDDVFLCSKNSWKKSN